jgi:hypothetical protein
VRWLSVPWINKQAGNQKASSNMAMAPCGNKHGEGSPGVKGTGTPEAILEMALNHGFKSSLLQ